MSLEFPKSRVPLLQELGARLLDSRKSGVSSDAFARELLIGFYDTCMHAGLDRVLSELEAAYPTIDLTDRVTLADQPALHAAVVTQIEAVKLDGGSPRAAKPGQVADSIVAALGLTLVDEPDRTITLDHAVRTDVASALMSVVEAELALPHFRETIVMKARALCEPQYLGTFTKIVEQLDDRGMRLIKQPKVPIDASQAVQRALTEARTAVFEKVGRVAIDRAKGKLEQANPEAAARIDQPVTQKLTPRDVAILRVCDPRVPKMPKEVVESLLGSLTEFANLAWRALERPVRPYAASQTFLPGELIEHPKFGRGEVLSGMAQRIEVEFPDGKHTLVHVAPKK